MTESYTNLPIIEQKIKINKSKSFQFIAHSRNGLWNETPCRGLWNRKQKLSTTYKKTRGKKTKNNQRWTTGNVKSRNILIWNGKVSFRLNYSVCNVLNPTKNNRTNETHTFGNVKIHGKVENEFTATKWKQ